MNAPMLEAAQVIDPPPGFWEHYSLSVTLVAVAVLAIAGGFWWLLAGDAESYAPRVPIFGGLLCLIIGLAAGAYGIAADGPTVNDPAVAAVIERSYKLTAVKATGEDPDVESLCQPVSLDSPEFEGIAEGQKVTFRVGIEDCEAPDPEIVITETTGRSVDVADLRTGEES